MDSIFRKNLESYHLRIKHEDDNDDIATKGWNECLNYIINNLENFHSTLHAGQYDYFADDDLKKWLKSLIRE